jgi:hypothetical protein
VSQPGGFVLAGEHQRSDALLVATRRDIIALVAFVLFHQTQQPSKRALLKALSPQQTRSICQV